MNYMEFSASMINLLGEALESGVLTEDERRAISCCVIGILSGKVQAPVRELASK